MARNEFNEEINFFQFVCTVFQLPDIVIMQVITTIDPFMTGKYNVFDDHKRSNIVQYM